MVEFKDLSSDSGLTELNKYLSTRSYIDGFRPSQADNNILPNIKAAVDGKKYPHVNRWLNHILSFEPAVRSTWSGKAAAATPAPAKGAAAKSAAPAEEDEDDDDFDMNLSDDEDESAANELIARKAAEKEAAKQAARSDKDISKMAKSTLILDVKPEASETDLDELEAKIREITKTGLLWGGCERIPVAFGIKKLRIVSVIIDDLIGVDDLQEEIEEMEGVQSTDVHAFNKI